MFKKLLPAGIILFLILVFFKSFILYQMLPIPSDTIIGLYNPFRDLYASSYPNGIPYKNSLITDPVRQQYPWRQMVIGAEKKMELPLWNPYSFSGVPLLANFQSAVYYPLNILLFFLPLSTGWGLLIFLQPLLAGVFLYLYLRKMKLSQIPSLLGAITFSFCGFSVAWMEWGTIVQTAMWLPLILLAIEKNLENKKLTVWAVIFILSLVFSFFAGHLQTFFYLFIISSVYILARWFQLGKSKKLFGLFAICYLLFAILTAMQWLPTLQFILLSNRVGDQNYMQTGWFIPWQHLVQFVVPDFFGNPATLNYWGVWNYAEFVGYVGIAPLLAAFFALFFRRDKKTFFFGTFFFLSLIFALPTGISSLPFVLKIPFLSTAQPTRLLFVTDFCLSVLAALGLDYLLKTEAKQKIFYIVAAVLVIFAGLWAFIFLGKHIVSAENLQTAKHNLVLPTILFFVSSALFVLTAKLKKLSQRNTLLLYIIIVAITVFDLFRFADKFLPFTNRAYLFPSTQAISFLQNQSGQFRIMTTDSQILPPNFSAMYRLQSIEGYDPLYLKNYGEFIAAMERKKPDITPPFGFSRIITPHDPNAKFIDLLNVKYVLSLSDLSSPNLAKVFQEGDTRVYENKNVLPRAFFVKDVLWKGTKQQVIDAMFDRNVDLKTTAVVQGEGSGSNFSAGNATITSYSENKVIVQTENNGNGYLVLTDVFYPTWHAAVDSKETKIYETDYTFRGIVVPAGKHTIIFSDSLF